MHFSKINLSTLYSVRLIIRLSTAESPAMFLRFIKAPSLFEWVTSEKSTRYKQIIIFKKQRNRLWSPKEWSQPELPTRYICSIFLSNNSGTSVCVGRIDLKTFVRLQIHYLIHLTLQYHRLGLRIAESFHSWLPLKLSTKYCELPNFILKSLHRDLLSLLFEFLVNIGETPQICTSELRHLKCGGSEGI